MPIRRESNGHSIDNRHTIDVKVFNRNVVALLDTGASRSCISKTFADQLTLNILPTKNNDKFLTLQAANGNNLQIAGQVEISIKLVDVIYHTRL